MYSFSAFERFFLRLSIPLSFELEGVVILTPSARAKVAETATRARVNATMQLRAGCQPRSEVPSYNEQT